MSGVLVTLVALEVVALVVVLGHPAVLVRYLEPFVCRQQRRLTRAEVREDKPRLLLAWVGGVVDLLLEAAVRGLTGLVEAVAVDVV